MSVSVWDWVSTAVPAKSDSDGIIRPIVSILALQSSLWGRET